MQNDIVPSQPNTTPPQEVSPQTPSTTPLETTQPVVAAVSPLEQQAAQFDREPASATTASASPTVLSSQPSVPDAFATPPVSTPPARKSSKKGLVIGGIVAGVLALVGGGGAAAYNMWYQNSDKVLGDALVNMIRAKTVVYKGTFDFESTESSGFSIMPSKVKLTIEGKSTSTDGSVDVTVAVTSEGKDVTLSGAGLFDKDGNIFFKVNDIRKMIESSGSSTKDMPKSVNDLITKVDGKWIKISADDLKEMSDSFGDDYSKTQTCLKETRSRFENDQAMTQEIISLYEKNRFILVKENLGSQGGSLGYRIEADTTKVKSFATGLNDTALLKELQKCDKDFKLDVDDLDVKEQTTDSKATTTFDVWIDRWSHQLTKAHLNVTSPSGKADIVVEPQFNTAVTITAPSDAISLSELKSDIEKMQSEYSRSLSYSPSGSSGLMSALYVSSAVESYASNHQGSYPTYTQLKADPSLEKLSAGLSNKLIATSPSAVNPSAVQYRLCGGRRYEVKYYDTTTKKVVAYGGKTCESA